MGGIDYVTKPINLQELQARVRTQLSLKKLHDENAAYLKEISFKNEQITNSINYALRIQKATLPPEDQVKSLLQEYFIIFKPKDIVSGDFYWIKKTDDKIVVVAADCTGHGVPGAFLSMYGIAFLNEIVIKENITDPAEILDHLRETAIKTLNAGRKEEIFDGMDIAILSISDNWSRLKYAGAFNPLWLVRDNELIVYKADRMPIGKFDKMNPFSCHDIELQKKDALYIFSDGYADQSGGDESSKFLIKRFRKLIVSNAAKSMKEQKEVLISEHNKWKGNEEQLDDIVIIGLRVP